MKVLLSLVLLAPAGFAQGHVLVVDAAGGGAYTQIGTALLNANSGDVLLVKSGTYAGFAIANQSVAVVGDATATAYVSGTVKVLNLAAGRTVLLHRLRAFGALGTSSNDGPGITLKNDIGAVRVQDCLAQGAVGKPGVRVEDAGDVALSMTQGLGGVTWPLSAEGLLANGTAIAIYECDLHGGAGAAPAGPNPPQCTGGSGGAALRSSTDGFAFVGSTLLVAGNATDGADGCYSGGPYSDWCNGGNGGSAIDLLAGAHVLWVLGNSLNPGHAGGGGYGQCGCGLVPTCDGDPGIPGVDYAADSGDTVTFLAGSSPTLTVGTNPSRESTVVSIQVNSGPGDNVLLVASSATSFTPQTSRGVRLVDPNAPYFTRRLGTVGPLGQILAGWAIPDLGPGVESQIVHLQVLAVHPNGRRLWSNLVSLVLLDGAF